MTFSGYRSLVAVLVMAVFLPLSTASGDEVPAWTEPLVFRSAPQTTEGLECLVKLRDGTTAFGTVRYAGDGIYRLTTERGIISFIKSDVETLAAGKEAVHFRETLQCMKNLLRLKLETRNYCSNHGSRRIREMKQYFPLVLYVDGVTPSLIRCPAGGYYKIDDWFDFSIRCTKHGGVRNCRSQLAVLGYEDETDRRLLELLGVALGICIIH